MSVVTSVGQGSAATSTAVRQAEYQVAVLKKQQEITKQAGSAVIQLIQSAAVPQPQHNVDVSV